MHCITTSALNPDTASSSCIAPSPPRSNSERCAATIARFRRSVRPVRCQHPQAVHHDTIRASAPAGSLYVQAASTSPPSNVLKTDTGVCVCVLRVGPAGASRGCNCLCGSLVEAALNGVAALSCHRCGVARLDLCHTRSFASGHHSRGRCVRERGGHSVRSWVCVDCRDNGGCSYQ
jgi:hypothetical protein